MLYKDMLLKLEYHKNNILKQFIKQGYFPNKEEIEETLKSIDNRLALFKTYICVPGQTFNAKEINHCLEMLYNDIAFLYKILEQIYIEKFNTMLLNVETHMIYLESLAEHFKKRADEEIKGTALGKTLLFKTDNWDIDINNESIDVFVGTLDLIQGSEIACFANINNTKKENILFKFKAEDGAKDFNALPYNYNNDTYIVPGEIAIKEHELNLSAEFNINSEIIIPFNPTLNNDYKILGGKDKIVVTDKTTNLIAVYDFPTVENPFEAPDNCYISFYTENIGEIEYNFNMKPYHSNFSIQDGTIKCNKDIQKVFIDVPKGFICYFNVQDNINIWATKEDAIIDNNALIYDGMLLVRDFKIKEYVKDKTTKYNITVSITEMDNDEIVDSIYIKEVS